MHGCVLYPLRGPFFGPHPEPPSAESGPEHQRSEVCSRCRDPSPSGREHHCGPRHGPRGPQHDPRGHFHEPHRTHHWQHRPHHGPHRPHHGPHRPHHGPFRYDFGPCHGPHNDFHDSGRPFCCDHRNPFERPENEEAHNPRSDFPGRFFPFHFFGLNHHGPWGRRGRPFDRFGPFGRPNPYDRFDRHCCRGCGTRSDCCDDVRRDPKSSCKKNKSDRCQRRKGCRNEDKNTDADPETVLVQNIIVETAPRSYSV